MKCPNCQRENKPDSRYCIFCGALLPADAPEQPLEPVQGADDTLAGQVQSLLGEVRRQARLLALMNERLSTVERTRGVAAPPPESVSATPSTAGPTPEATPLATRWEGPVAQAPPVLPKRRSPRAVEREWEQILGGNWLARIGVLALVIGAGFFLKYAFDNDWIGPTGRVILGIVVGLGLIGGGHYWRRRYPTFAQALSGGGIAILYLSIFAASGIYDLVNIYAAFGFLFLVSSASAGLAILYNAMALAIIGILGAFIAPLIMAVSPAGAPGAAGAARSFWLLVYVMVVDLGVLALSTFRNWRWFTLLALIGSLATYGAWYGWYGDDVSLLTSEGSLTLIFLIFVGATTLYHFVWRRAAQEFDYAVMIINAAFYFGISYGLMWDDLRVWLGGFSLLLALLYGGLAYIAIRRGPENIRLGFFALGIALVFVTVAIPVQLLHLGFTAWTIAWAAEGTVLVWLSFRLRLPQVRFFGYIVFAGVALRLVGFDTVVNMRTFTPVLNERFLAFAVSIAALYITAYLLWRERKSLWAQEGSAWSVYPVFLVAANFFTVWLLSAEVWGYFSGELAERTWAAGSALRSARNLSLTGLWAVYAVALLVVGIVRRYRLVRLSALALLGIPIVKVFVYDVFALEQVYRIVAFVGLGVLLLVSAYLYQRYSKSIRGFLASE